MEVFKFFLVSFLVTSSATAATSNFHQALEAELAQMDQSLGEILTRSQEKLWRYESDPFGDDQNVPVPAVLGSINENATAFYELYTSWASFRYFSTLQCPSASALSPYRHLCAYLGEALRRFGADPTESSTPSTVDLQIDIHKLAALYRQLEGIFYKGQIYEGESALDELMQRLNESEALKLWQSRSKTVGKLGDLFGEIMLKLAKSGKGNDLWTAWHADLDIDDPLHEATALWSQVKPFYNLLFDYLLDRLQLNGTTTLPVHALGSFSGTSFEGLPKTIRPFSNSQSEVNKLPANFPALLRSAEQIFSSLGFPVLPPSYWTRSKWIATPPTQSCHPITSIFFRRAVDIRSRMCYSKEALDNAHIWRQIVHELGHAHYYQAYSRSPNLLKLGPNTAVHEAVGDAVYLMHSSCKASASRSGPEEVLINRLFDEALATFVRIPYALSLEMWRHEVMTDVKGPKNPEYLNQRYWTIREDIQRVSRPVGAGTSQGQLDPLAKYHVANFMPYLRYLFGTFMAHQIQAEVCQGNASSCCPTKEGLGRLRNFLIHGVTGSANYKWSLLTGTSAAPFHYQAGPLLNYYKPLIDWLQKWKQQQQQKSHI